MRTSYRRASAQLDERPDPRVRRAVLAAAEDAIASKPVVVNPFSARRWPLSMAAVLVVALMVGLVVDRAADEGPDRITSVGPAAGRVVATPEARVDAVADRRAEGAPKESASAKVAVADAAPAVSAVPKRDEFESRKPAITASRVAPAQAVDRAQPVDRASLSQKGEFAPQMASKAVEPASVQPSTPPTAVAMAAPAPRAAEAMAERSRDGADANQFARATTVRRFATAEPVTPEAWVERIVKLRDAGNNDEADREVVALRRRYPEFVVPAAALGASGTR